MTGLDVVNDVIIEISCVITNGNLEVMDEKGWNAVIHQEQETMDKMVCTSSISSNPNLQASIYLLPFPYLRFHSLNVSLPYLQFLNL